MIREKVRDRGEPVRGGRAPRRRVGGRSPGGRGIRAEARVTDVPARGVEHFEVSRERGFLPVPDPLRRLPSRFDPWEEVALQFPKLLAAGTLRTKLDRLPLIEVSRLNGLSQWRRAMLLLSYFGHGYVWGGRSPAERLPPAVAIPWHRVAQELGRPPVLSYASYALDNWRRLDPHRPIELGNIVLLQNFLGGLDEEWFVAVHVDIEAKAAPALEAIGLAQEAVAVDDAAAADEQLRRIALSLDRMISTLERMPEGCDPYIYYTRVRPYIFGWQDHPALPRGVVYEGVGEYGGRPQRFRGETGAETGIIPSLDAALGVAHRDDPLRHYLSELRTYMPPGHRAYLEAVEHGPSVRDYVLSARGTFPALRDAYNACVERVSRFRSLHLEYAGRYIQLQAQKSPSNPTGVGTGGTPFMRYLQKHREEALAHLIP